MFSVFWALLVGLLCVGLGGLGLYYAPVVYRRYRYVDDLPTSTVRAAAVGLTEIKGRVVAAGEPFPSPFRERPCVLCHYAYYGRTSAREKGSVPREAGTLGVPFYVEDETGRMLVRPEGAEIKLPDHLSAFISDAGRIEAIAPPVVERFEERKQSGTLPDLGGGRATTANAVFGLMQDGSSDPPVGPSRGAEVCLQEGDEVYVLGTAQPLNGQAGANAVPSDGVAVQTGEEALFIGRTPGSGGAFPRIFGAVPYLSAGYESIFEIYAGCEENLAAQSKREIKKQMGIGLLLLLVGLLMLIGMLMWAFHGGGG